MSDLALPLIATALLWAALLWLIRSDIEEAQRILSGPDRGGPDEPCWAEPIESDERYRYSRGQCVNDELIEMDRRAARGDFPIPPMY
jgi:hypothetical protein